jgi:hypothetical protein
MRNQIVKISSLLRLLGGLPILAQQKGAQPNVGGTSSMFRLKTSHLILLLGLIAPVSGFATEHYCIAADGGWPGGGTTYIAPNFPLPAVGTCGPWQGFTKTAGTVIVFSYGTGCLSTDGKALTVAVTSQNPNWINGSSDGDDYIVLERSEDKGPFSGSDSGALVFGTASAKPVACTAALLELPSSHA